MKISNIIKCFSIAFSLLTIIGSFSPAFSKENGELFNNYKVNIRAPISGDFLYLPGIPIRKNTQVSSEISIAIVDSGIAINHPQIIGYIVDEVDFTSEGVYDQLGHGTVVTLIFLKSLNMGVKDAQFNNIKIGVINVKVANKKGIVKKEWLIDAVKWIGRKGIKIANLSLGFEGSKEEHKDLCEAIELEKDVLFVVAAGNSGASINTYPAACKLDNVWSVGASKDEIIEKYSGRAEIYAPGSVRLFKYSEILYNEGIVLAKEGFFLKALLKFKKAIEHEPSSEAYFQRGIIFMHQNNYLNAKIELKYAIRINPDFPEALEHLGLIYYFEKDYKIANEYLDQAAYLAPNHPRIQLNYSKVLSAIKEKQSLQK